MPQLKIPSAATKTWCNQVNKFFKKEHSIDTQKKPMSLPCPAKASLPKSAEPASSERTDPRHAHPSPTSPPPTGDKLLKEYRHGGGAGIIKCFLGIKSSKMNKASSKMGLTSSGGRTVILTQYSFPDTHSALKAWIPRPLQHVNHRSAHPSLQEPNCSTTWHPPQLLHHPST